MLGTPLQLFPVSIDVLIINELIPFSLSNVFKMIRQSYQDRFVQGVLSTETWCLLSLRLLLTLGIIAICGIAVYLWMSDELQFYFFFIEWTRCLGIITVITSAINLYGLYKGKRKFLKAAYWVLVVNTLILSIYYIECTITFINTEEHNEDRVHLKFIIVFYIDLILRILMMGHLSKTIKIIDIIKEGLPVKVNMNMNRTNSSSTFSSSRPSTV